MSKTCFVIGPIGEAGSQVRADADDFMKYIVSACPALQEFDYSEPVRADQLKEPGRITSQIIRLLIEADLVIADLTGNNPNVYYELSLRHAIGKPVIHMALAGTSLSFDIRDNRTIPFTMHSRIAENARDELAHQIRRVHQEGYKAMNPILETVGIVNLERATDPVQKTIGTLMEMVESLGGDVKSLASAFQQVRLEQVIASSPGASIGGGIGRGGLFGVPPLTIRDLIASGTGGGTMLGSGFNSLSGLDHVSEAPNPAKPSGKPSQKK